MWLRLHTYFLVLITYSELDRFNSAAKHTGAGVAATPHSYQSKSSITDKDIRCMGDPKALLIPDDGDLWECPGACTGQ